MRLNGACTPAPLHPGCARTSNNIAQATCMSYDKIGTRRERISALCHAACQGTVHNCCKRRGLGLLCTIHPPVLLHGATSVATKTRFRGLVVFSWVELVATAPLLAEALGTTCLRLTKTRAAWAARGVAGAATGATARVAGAAACATTGATAALRALALETLA